MFHINICLQSKLYFSSYLLNTKTLHNPTFCEIKNEAMNLCNIYFDYHVHVCENYCSNSRDIRQRW